MIGNFRQSLLPAIYYTVRAATRMRALRLANALPAVRSLHQSCNETTAKFKQSAIETHDSHQNIWNPDRADPQRFVLSCDSVKNISYTIPIEANVSKTSQATTVDSHILNYCPITSRTSTWTYYWTCPFRSMSNCYCSTSISRGP